MIRASFLVPSSPPPRFLPDVIAERIRTRRFMFGEIRESELGSFSPRSHGCSFCIIVGLRHGHGHPLLRKRQDDLLHPERSEIVAYVPLACLLRYVLRDVERRSQTRIKGQNSCVAVALLPSLHPGKAMEMFDVGNQQVKVKPPRSLAILIGSKPGNRKSSGSLQVT